MPKKQKDILVKDRENWEDLRNTRLFSIMTIIPR